MVEANELGPPCHLADSVESNSALSEVIWGLRSGESPSQASAVLRSPLGTWRRMRMIRSAAKSATSRERWPPHGSRLPPGSHHRGGASAARHPLRVPWLRSCPGAVARAWRSGRLLVNLPTFGGRYTPAVHLTPIYFDALQWSPACLRAAREVLRRGPPAARSRRGVSTSGPGQSTS
jgi:hypothetical protein